VEFSVEIKHHKNQHDETTDHLLASCVFAREVWFRLLQPAGLQGVELQGNSTLLEWWQQGRATLPQVLRTSFDSLVLLTSWCLWKERNRRTFDHKSRSPSHLLSIILEETDSWTGVAHLAGPSVALETRSLTSRTTRSLASTTLYFHR